MKASSEYDTYCKEIYFKFKNGDELLVTRAKIADDTGDELFLTQWISAQAEDHKYRINKGDVLWAKVIV